jgi:hypothetical protein
VKGRRGEKPGSVQSEPPFYRQQFLAKPLDFRGSLIARKRPTAYGSFHQAENPMRTQNLFRPACSNREASAFKGFRDWAEF